MNLIVNAVFQNTIGYKKKSEDNKGVISSQDGQIIQWPEGQTIKWPEGQTIQWPEGKTMIY